MSNATLYRGRTKTQALAWGNRQKYLALSAGQVAALDEIYPEWRTTLDGVWLSHLEATEAFLGAQDRFPRQNSPDRSERKLGSWLASQRYRIEKLPSDRRKLLDERLPDWNKCRDDTWNERLEELRSYFVAHGRIPPNGADETSARRARTWLNNQSTLPVGSERRDRLDTAIPGWSRTEEDIWNERLSALVEFVGVHGRMPTQREKNPDDRRLGVWRGTQRVATSLSDRRRAALNANAPGWDETTDEKWEAALNYVVAFRAARGSMPNSKSDDSEESAHGRWIQTQRRTSGISKYRMEQLDLRLPSWRETAEDRWLQHLKYVAEFEAAHRRLPSGRSADFEEVQSARWLVNQRKGAGMTAEREALLDSTIPSWRETPADTWHRRLGECEEFYRLHGRRARVDAKDAEERVLGAWYSNTKAGRLTAERKAILAAAELGDQRTNDEIWEDNLKATAGFVKRHGRFPAITRGKDGERPLAIWLANQRSVKNMAPGRLAAMNAKVPEWNLTMEALWRSKLGRCTVFVQAHGRFPGLGKNATADERQLAEWLFGQRKTLSKTKPDRLAALDAQLPGWRGQAAR